MKYIPPIKKNLETLSSDNYKPTFGPPCIFFYCEYITHNVTFLLSIKHRAGQRCFELLALIGSPQLLQGRQDVAIPFILLYLNEVESDSILFK